MARLQELRFCQLQSLYILCSQIRRREAEGDMSMSIAVKHACVRVCARVHGCDLGVLPSQEGLDALFDLGTYTLAQPTQAPLTLHL